MLVCLRGTEQVPLAVATQLLNASKAQTAKPKAVPISRAPVGRGGRVATAKAVRAAPVARRPQQQQPVARQAGARGGGARKPAPVTQVSYSCQLLWLTCKRSGETRRVLRQALGSADA